MQVKAPPEFWSGAIAWRSMARSRGASQLGVIVVRVSRLQKGKRDMGTTTE
jgi:hypothetical protein